VRRLTIELEHFPVRWNRLTIQKMRKNKNLERPIRCNRIDNRSRRGGFRCPPRHPSRRGVPCTNAPRLPSFPGEESLPAGSRSTSGGHFYAIRDCFLRARPLPALRGYGELRAALRVARWRIQR